MAGANPILNEKENLWSKGSSLLPFLILAWLNFLKRQQKKSASTGSLMHNIF